jgi:hypothetical protein
MMRLSPRLICFIGTSGLLLHSALAAQEEKTAPWQELSDNLSFLVDPETGHKILKCEDEYLCNIHEVTRNKKTKTVAFVGTKCEYDYDNNKVKFLEFNHAITVED